ncbi:unnamed protein product [Ceratitis capitata]|uniref:(Mediterranean fruit fly) hypothetical protein n=1 Tax=Ceratitis capitata TaxID=7213 RepID=A0A811VH18_CERCA|nr:unnamed protein product [Ceratitis capitata]
MYATVRGIVPAAAHTCQLLQQVHFDAATTLRSRFLCISSELNSAAEAARKANMAMENCEVKSAHVITAVFRSSAGADT